MKQTFSSLEKVLSDVTSRVSNVGQIVLMAMVLLVIVDVFLRRFFNSPISWTLEIIEVMLVAVVFFSVAYCGARKAHISIDALVSRFPPKIRNTIDVLTYFLSVVLFAAMTWGAVLTAIDEFDTHRVTGILPVPIYPFALVVAFGSLLLALVLLIHLLNLIISMVRK